MLYSGEYNTWVSDAGCISCVLMVPGTSPGALQEEAGKQREPKGQWKSGKETFEKTKAQALAGLRWQKEENLP